MKKKVVSVILAMTMVASMAMGCGNSSDTTTSDNSTTTTTTNDAAASTEASDAADATADAANGDLADKKVGVCIYQFADNFMTLFRGELENYLVEQGFSKDNITIVDGANDQATQTNQIQNFITQGVDVLIINPVNSSSAETITDMVVEAGIPLVYINREPDASEEQRWADNNWDVTYVGCDARQSGTYQGEEIAELENITVSDEDVEKEYADMAEQYKMEADKIREAIGESGLEQMKKDMAELIADELLMKVVGIATLIIHDKFGMLMKKEVDGKSREERFIDEWEKQYELFEAGRYSGGAA